MSENEFTAQLDATHKEILALATGLGETDAERESIRAFTQLLAKIAQLFTKRWRNARPINLKSPLSPRTGSHA